MADLDPRYASPGLRWGLYLEDHPDATAEFSLATAESLGIPDSFAGTGELVVATIHTPGRPDVIGYKEIPLKEERWSGPAGSRTKKLVDVERTPELWQVLCTKALGRAVKRAGYPDHLPDLKALVLWRQRRAELTALAAGERVTPPAGELERGLDEAAVIDAEEVEPGDVDGVVDDPVPETEGRCPVPGCATGGAHRHPPYELADKTGTLEADVAGEWDLETWSRFLVDHGVNVSDALREARAHAETNNLPRPTSLRTLARADAEFLLHFARDRGRPS